MTGDLTAASKFLAWALRHDPVAAGLELGPGGWARADGLLAAAERHGHPLTAQELRQLVQAPGKRRFEARDGLIRAAQGHSVPVDLGLDPVRPPAVLYHGTVARFLPAIAAQGLRPGRRVHVHLSADEESAIAVGARRGRPVVLRVGAERMWQAGHEFFRASNGVWLTGLVPPAFLAGPPGEPAGGQPNPGTLPPAVVPMWAGRPPWPAYGRPATRTSTSTVPAQSARRPAARPAAFRDRGIVAGCG